jgi:hypothetical protein
LASSWLHLANESESLTDWSGFFGLLSSPEKGGKKASKSRF